MPKMDARIVLPCRVPDCAAVFPITPAGHARRQQHELQFATDEGKPGCRRRFLAKDCDSDTAFRMENNFAKVR